MVARKLVKEITSLSYQVLEKYSLNSGKVFAPFK